MKKVINILTVVGLCLGLTACGANTPEKQFVANVKTCFEKRVDYEKENKNKLSDAYKQAEDNLELREFSIKMYKTYNKMEREYVGKLTDYNFTDKRMKKLAKQYFAANEGVDPNKYPAFCQKYHTTPSSLKSKVISELADDYGLKIDDDKYVEYFEEKTKYPATEKKITISKWLSKQTKEFNSSELTENKYTSEYENEDNHVYYNNEIKNTSPYDLKNIYVKYSFYDSNENVITSQEEKIDELKKGEAQEIKLEYNKQMGEFSRCVVEITQADNTTNYTDNSIYLYQCFGGRPYTFSVDTSNEISSK